MTKAKRDYVLLLATDSEVPQPTFLFFTARVILAVSCTGLTQNATQCCEGFSQNTAIMRVTRFHGLHSTTSEKLATLTDGRGVVPLSGALRTVIGRFGKVHTLDQNLEFHLLSAVRSCLISTFTSTLKHQYVGRLLEFKPDGRQGKCQGTNFPSCGAINLITSLTPQDSVLPEKLIGLQPIQKLPTFYGARRFINTLTSPRHLPLS